MITTMRYSEKADGGWLPGLLLTDDRCAGWRIQPYGKLTRWPHIGGGQWAALVHANGFTVRLVTERMSARQAFRWVSAHIREAITGGRNGTSNLYRATLDLREEKTNALCCEG